MNKKINETEILDLLLGELILDSNTTSPYSEALDPETLGLLKQVVQVEQEQARDDLNETRITTRVWQRVLANVQVTGRSKIHPLHRAFHLPLSINKKWLQIALAITIILIAVVISLYSLARHTSLVNAQEIVSKANATLSSPSNGGVHSFFLTEVQHTVPTNERLNAQSSFRGDEQILTQTKRWYEAPNRWRAEYQQQVLSADGQEISHSNFLEISDGTNIWYVDPEHNMITVNQYITDIAGKGGVALFGQNVGVLTDLLKQASSCYAPKVIGSASIARRTTHVIDLGPTKCPSASAPEMNGRLVLWVDKETYFILKQELYNTEGDQVILASEVSQVQYNPSLDPSLFTFTPPDGANITNNRPKPAPSIDQYQNQLEQLARQLDFPIFMPAYLPQGLAPRQPQLIPQEGNLVELAYVPPDEVEKDTSAAAKGILIREQLATYSLVAGWIEGADPLTIPKGTSWLRRGRRNADGTGTDSVAIVLRDGTLVSISSFAIAPDELTKIAASLNPAPGSHAALPNPTPPTLEKIRGKVSFPVFIPTYLPEGLAPESLTGGDSPNQNVEIKYVYPDGSNGLVIINARLDCCPGLLQMQSEEVNFPSGIIAHLIRIPVTVYGGMTLWWEQESTHLEISAPNLTEEQLIKIASSMSQTADLGTIQERSPVSNPTQPAALPFDLLLPTWLPEEATKSVLVDGEVVTISFDPHPADAPHSVLTLMEMPASLIPPGGSPDPQAVQEQIGTLNVTVIWRGENCMTFEWYIGDLYLQLTNPYDPPGQPRYSCDQLRKMVESIYK